MKFISAVFLASVAFTSAQLTFNDDGSITCAIPDAAYCAGGSLGTNIIVRCTGTVGHGGNCNDNLSGEAPVGVSYAPCWQTSATSGDAACSKNCKVFAGSGSGKQNGTFMIPDCTPVGETSTVASTSSTATAYSWNATSTTSTTYMQSSSFSIVTSSVTTSTTSSTSSSVGPIVTGTGTGTGTPSCYGNCTIPTGGSGVSGSAATATPKSPALPPSSVFSGATANSAGALLAAVGILFAFFL